MAKGIWQKYNTINATRKELASGSPNAMGVTIAGYTDGTMSWLVSSIGKKKYNAGTSLGVSGNNVSIYFGATISEMRSKISSGQKPRYYYPFTVDGNNRWSESRCGEPGTTGISRYVASAITNSVEDPYSDGTWRASIEQGSIIVYCVKDVPYKDKGTYIANVTADVGTYPANGIHSDGYWYVYKSLVPPNAPKTLNVPTVITGGKANTISWSVATSEGATLAGYELYRITDGGTAVRIYRGTALSYADVVPYGSNTVQYSVRSYDVDNQASVYTTGAVKTVLNNNPPVITGADEDKGSINVGYAYTYSVDDEDTADTITITEAIDGVTLRTHEATRNTEYTIDVTGLTWLALLNGAHTLTITAVDNRGGTAIRTIRWVKAVNVIEFELSAPLACDARVTKAVMSMASEIPIGATVTITACNNGNDAEPTWIDVTAKVLNGEKIFFANENKTALDWGYGLKVKIDRGVTEGDCYIYSIGGNFE